MLRTSAGWGKFGYLSTDRRKKFTLNFNMFHFTPFQKGETSNANYSVFVRYQPTNRFNLSLGPRYSPSKRALQYVTNISRSADPADTRYINASIDQETFSMSLRLNYTVNQIYLSNIGGNPLFPKRNTAISNISLIVGPRIIRIDTKNLQLIKFILNLPMAAIMLMKTRMVTLITPLVIPTLALSNSDQIWWPGGNTYLGQNSS